MCPVDIAKRTHEPIRIRGASAHNLKNIDVDFELSKITVVTGVSGSGKSTLVFDTLLTQAKHHFFSTLPHFNRGLFHMGEPARADNISGLSLAISLEQAETAPSSRATVATLTNIGELLGVLWSRFGLQYCPTHHEICATNVSSSEMARQIMRDYAGCRVAILAPIVENKMGLFRKEIYRARAEGCPQMVINGQVYNLAETLPEFHLRKKYTIKIVVGQLILSDHTFEELAEQIYLASTLASGYIEVSAQEQPSDTQSGDGSQELELAARLAHHLRKYSLSGGCPQCGFSWPALDSRYFSQNSLGRCPECDGFGTLADDASDVGVDGHLYQHRYGVCNHCDGTGLNPDLDPITLSNHSLRSLYLMEIDELAHVVAGLAETIAVTEQNDALWLVLEELKHEVARVKQLGLGHLSLSRRILSLSHGERQRLRLSGILTEPLSGVLYVLDEPSQGLHPADLEVIWGNIDYLRSLGNTIVIVDHDEFCWQQADHIVELGPGGGKDGGAITASFKPSQAAQWREDSLTARILCDAAENADNNTHNNHNSSIDEDSKVELPEKEESNGAEFISFEQVKYRHLAMDHVRIKQAALNVVCGVSGVGKTSLVMGVIAESLRRWQQVQPTRSQSATAQESPQVAYKAFGCSSMTGVDVDTRVVVVDRKPLGKSSVSMPATYLGCMGSLRDLYAALSSAQLAGLTRQHFSLMHDLGRCSVCGGRGYIKHEMKFLAPTREVCPECHGQRYQEMILGIHYKSHSLADLLALSLQEVAEIFKAHRQISKCLAPALSLGLGYLIFGQPSRSLSGGEAQRLKLATYLKVKPKHGEVLIIDEPTRGLHHEDVKYLMRSLKQMTDHGTTIVLVEHHSEVLKQGDWLIDLGYGGGRLGGQKIFEGELSEFHNFYQHSPECSLTAKHLFGASS